MASRTAFSLRTFLIFFFLVLGPTLGLSEIQAASPARRMVLDNRLTLLVQEEHSLPFVTMQLLVNAGSWADAAGKEGLAHLTAKGLLLGTRKHTETTMQEELDFMGAHLDSSVGKDFAALTLQVLKKDLDKGFGLFMESLTQPAFPEKEIRREAENTLAAIRAAEDQPEVVAEKAFQKALFLSGPYGHPVKGTPESLPTVTREDLLSFYAHYYHPNNSILAIVGDISADEVKKELVPALESWPAGRIPKADLKTTFAEGPKTMKIDRDLTQANIILGSPGLKRDNPDYYAVSVMNYILGGGGFASRLLEEIRNKKGLAYSVASFYEAGKYPGSFRVVLQTKNSSAREAIAIALEQMKRMQREKVSDKELAGAKRYLVGSFPLRLDTQTKMADFLGQVEYYGLGLDYARRYRSLINSVTAEDVLRVARAYLHPDSCLRVVVGRLKEMGAD